MFLADHRLCIAVLCCFRAVQAPVLQRGHIISSGCRQRRNNRKKSLFKPKASAWVKYCWRFPGKISRKNKAVNHPIGTCFDTQNSNAIPSKISTAPDKLTTKPGSNGSQEGTCARNGICNQVRCPVPVNNKSNPNNTLKRRCVLVVEIII